MRRCISIMLILFLVSSMFVGCTNGNGEESNAEESIESSNAPAEEILADSFKVALVLPESINDGGWNASAYAGLLQLEEKYGAVISYSENTKHSEFDEVFRIYAEEGFDIIFAHGNEFADSVLHIAPNYPETQFCITASNTVQEPNVSSLNTDNAEQGFIAGIVAGALSEAKSVGMIAGMDIPASTDSVIGFEEGVKYINPDIKVTSTYVGDYVDAVKAKEIAYSMIDAGVDIIAHNAGSAGNGVFEACKDRGVYAIGAIADQSSIAPDQIVTSAMSDMPKAFAAFVDSYLMEDFKVSSLAFGVTEEAVYLAPYMDGVLTEAQIVLIQEVLEALKTDELDIRTLAEYSL